MSDRVDRYPPLGEPLAGEALMDPLSIGALISLLELGRHWQFIHRYNRTPPLPYPEASTSRFHAEFTTTMSDRVDRYPPLGEPSAGEALMDPLSTGALVSLLELGRQWQFIHRYNRTPPLPYPEVFTSRFTLSHKELVELLSTGRVTTSRPHFNPALFSISTLDNPLNSTSRAASVSSIPMVVVEPPIEQPDIPIPDGMEEHINHINGTPPGPTSSTSNNRDTRAFHHLALLTGMLLTVHALMTDFWDEPDHNNNHLMVPLRVPDAVLLPRRRTEQEHEAAGTSSPSNPF